MPLIVCNAHIATDLVSTRAGRPFDLCRAMLDEGDDACASCGTPSPRRRIASWWDNFVRGEENGNGADLARTLSKGHRRTKRTPPAVR